jgi:imidazolonepropionase-like amidohydrolase
MLRAWNRARNARGPALFVALLVLLILFVGSILTIQMAERATPGYRSDGPRFDGSWWRWCRIPPATSRTRRPPSSCERTTASWLSLATPPRPGDQSPSGDLMIRVVGGMVIDVAAGRARRADLAIDGPRIVAVERMAKPSGSDAVIDAAGLFLLPGLIDCHVHLAMRGEDTDPAAIADRSDRQIALDAADAAARSVRGGITTVRDVGGWNHLELALRGDVERGAREGPRLLLAGRLLSAPTPAARYYPGMYEVVRGANEVRAAVRAQLDAGADLIKVMATGAMLSPEDEDAGEAQLTPDELGAAVETAAEVGAHVAAHAHALDGIRNAVEAGVASIEHGTFADDAVLRRMAGQGTFLVPTLSASPPPGDPVLEAMPRHIRERFEATWEIHLAAMRLAHRLGVNIAMGTDAGTPGNHHGTNAQECVRMVEEIGMAAEEAIRSATVTAARLLRRDAALGKLEPGMDADIAGYRSNPLEDIRELTRVAFVMARGRRIRT